MDEEILKQDVGNCEVQDIVSSLKNAEEAVDKLQEELRKLKVVRTIQEDQDPTLVVSQTKQAGLLAELRILQEKKVSEIEVSYPLIIELVKKHLQQQEQSLKQTLEVISSQTVTLEDEEQKYKKIIEEEYHLISILEKELKEQESQPVHQESRKIEHLQRRLSKARKLRKQRMHETRLFLQTYFPLPEKEILLKHMKKEQLDENGEPNVISLGELLELLLNKMLEKPYDPWITIDDCMWPPYIELLLRYNIIVRHPEKCTLIKLETQLS